MRLKNKVAIVTGAASGFGAETARLFAREGAQVVVADLNIVGANAVAAEIGSAGLAIQCDVSRRDDVDRLVAACIKEFSVPDIVVNNAGFTHVNQPLLNVDEALFDKVYAVNVKSIFHMVHAVVPHMRQRGSGVMLNIGSTAGIRPRPGLTWYNGSKALAVELGKDGIRVNVICPVMGETGMLSDFMGVPDTQENRERFIATIPLGRLCRPLDIARAALYLASDEAEFITGVEFPVDGGRTV
jgi:3-oxoacyl-[acyl-carrier protein] reductase